MEEERFKPIKGYEGSYSITSYGRVISHKGSQGDSYERALVPLPNGYITVQLYKNNVHDSRYVHILVLEAFGPQKPEGINIEGNHKSRDRSNNNISNLEWMTSQENSVHALKESGGFPLSDDQILDIRARIKLGESPARTAGRYSLSTQRVYQITSRHSYKHVTDEVLEAFVSELPKHRIENILNPGSGRAVKSVEFYQSVDSEEAA